MDYASDGSIVGIEIINAYKNIDNLNKIDISGTAGEYSFAMAV
ncbi:hypothetical protein [Runella sp.]